MSWRRILLLSFAFLLLLGGATWAVLQRSDAATQWLQRALQQALRCRSWIGGSELDFAAGRLTVHRVLLEDPRAAPGTPLLQLGRIDAELTLDPLGELVALRSVQIDDLLLQLGPELPTLAELLAAPPAAGAAPRAPAALPAIELRGGRVRWTPRRDQAPLELRELALQIRPEHDAPQRAVLRGSALLADLGLRLQLLGNADLATGAAQLVATFDPLAIDRALLDRLGPLLGADLARVDAAARLRGLQLRLQLPPAADGAPPTAELVGELQLDRFGAPDVPNPVRSAAVRFQASTRQQGELRLHLVQRHEAGDLDVTAHATGCLGELQLEVRANGRDLRIDQPVLDTLQTFATGRDVTAALRPTAGRADLALFLQNPQRRGGAAELDLVLRDVAMSYHGFGDEVDRVAFPLPMVQARGRVRLRDDVVLIEDVTAQIAPEAGGGEVRLVGRVETRRPGGEDTTLDIEADHVVFNDHLRRALVALLHDDGRLYDRLQPSGRTAVQVHVRPRSELLGGWSVTVRPDGAAMRWQGFPYPLLDLRGEVVARSEGVDFDLRGQHGPGRLSMRGRIPLGAGGDAESACFEAVVGLQDVAIDDELRAAVAVLVPELDAAWRDAAPAGRFGGEVKVWRPEPSAPLSHDAVLQLDGVDLRLPCGSWRATELHGQVLVQGSGSRSRVDFDALRGRLGHGQGQPAQLALLGSLVGGDDLHRDLVFVVRDLQLDEVLGQSLEQLGALGAGTWASLRPSGTVDLVCRHEGGGGAADQIGLIVQLVDVASTAPILPKPATRMTGELSVGGGVLRFSDVRAELGGALVRCRDGTVRTLPDGRTELQFRVATNGFPVDSGLANLFSGPLRQAVLDRQLDGRADVDELALRFAIPPTGSTLPFTTTIGGQLRLYDVSMALNARPGGLRVEGVNGVLGIAESTVADTGGGLQGSLNGVSLRLFDQPFEGIEALFTADAEHLALRDLRARCHGGLLQQRGREAPALHYLLPGPAAPDGRLAADLQFERVDVFAFLSRTGWPNPPYSGAASGELRLERLDGDDVVEARGSGRLQIQRGDLGAVPLFTAIYAQLPAPERPRFDTLDSRFRLADRRLQLESLSLRSNLLAANGKGHLDLDGYLDVELKLDNLLGPSADPVVMPLVTLLTQNIVRFHLFGYLRQLRAEKRWVTEGDPGRAETVPMPPFAARQPPPDF